MPTYDYECGACDHTFEVFQSIKDPVKRKCPVCGKSSLRLIGAGAALIFKGSGFYKTDYRSDSYSKGAAADKKSDSGSTSDSKAADTKPATDSAGEKSTKKSKPRAK